MGDGSGEKEALGWAAHDSSGHLSPFNFKRRSTGPEDVVFRIVFCGVCYSDLGQIKDEWKTSKYPMIPGHELVGFVTEVGPEVTKFKVGDRVGVSTIVNACKKCFSCTSGLNQFCEVRPVWTYNDVDYDGTPTYGGYSNLMVIKQSYCLKIPENLPLDEAAPLLCAGITVYSPMKYYRMEEGGKNFGLVGLGGLGHMAVKFAKAYGMHVTVISTSPKKEKEARESLGADNFIISKDEEKMKAAAKSLDFIIDTVSGAHPVDPYLQLLRANGKYVLVGLPPGNLEVDPVKLLYGRLSVGGSCVGSIGEIQEMLDYCGKKNITCQIEKIPISYINEAMTRLAKSDVHYRFVIDVENSLKEGPS